MDARDPSGAGYSERPALALADFRSMEIEVENSAGNWVKTKVLLVPTVP